MRGGDCGGDGDLGIRGQPRAGGEELCNHAREEYTTRGSAQQVLYTRSPR